MLPREMRVASCLLLSVCMVALALNGESLSEPAEVRKPRPEPKAPAVRVVTRSGSKISGRSIAIDDVSCTVDSLLLGAVSLPRRELVHIFFGGRSAPSWGKRTEDRVLLGRGDRLHGKVVAIKQGILTAQTVAGTGRIPTESLKAVFFAEPTVAKDTKEQEYRDVYIVHFSNGDRVVVDQMVLTDTTCSMQSRLLGGIQADAKVFGKAVAHRLQPRHVPSGNLLLADYRGGRVIRIDRSGEVAWEMAGFDEPRDARLLPNGNILVAEERGKRVLEVTLDRETVWSRSVADELDRAVKLPSGTIVAASRSRHQLVTISENGALKPFGNYRSVRNLAISANGNLLICDPYACREIDEQGNTLWEYKARNPTSIQPLAGGRFLVAQKDPKRISEISRAGVVLWKADIEDSPIAARRLSDGANAVLTEDGLRLLDADANEIWRFTITLR